MHQLQKKCYNEYRFILELKIYLNYVKNTSKTTSQGLYQPYENNFFYAFPYKLISAFITYITGNEKFGNFIKDILSIGYDDERDNMKRRIEEKKMDGKQKSQNEKSKKEMAVKNQMILYLRL